MPFERSLLDEVINKLKNDPLFKERLFPDIINQKGVFPAIRKDKITFYYKGGKLFTYSKDGYETHYKYGIIPKNIKNNYIKESNLQNISLYDSFKEGYKKIKECCELYCGIEAEYVSKLYICSGMNPYNSVILLDTEVRFDSDNDSIDENLDKKQRKQNIERIDTLLYNTESKQLCFCEAKHFSNKELWAEESSKPQVCSQINKYNKTIETRTDEIIKQYQNYVDIFNKLFDTSIPKPESIFMKTGLLIFGYDSNQKNKINELLIRDGSLEGISYYNTGNLKGNQIATLYDSITK